MECEALSLAQRQYLQQLNDHFMAIERQVKQDALALISHLEARVEDPQDALCDYEIELEVQCWLRKDDPTYREDDDNILVTLTDYLTTLRDPHHTGIADGYNWNTFHYREGHPLRAEFHCWLYHCLYDHRHVPWDDLLRIGRLWVNMPVIHQYAWDVAP
jgi:hypothetical protein